MPSARTLNSASSKRSTLLLRYIKYYFLPADHKMQFIASCEAKKSFFWLSNNKKSCVTRLKYLFYSCDCSPHFSRAPNFTLAKLTFFSLVAQYIISVLNMIFFYSGVQKWIYLHRRGQLNALYDPLIKKNFF